MNKYIIITGVNGFIGNNMAEWCLKSGYSVIGIDMGVMAVKRGIIYFQMNLCDESIDDILRTYNPFALIHCAGMADVNYSIKYPDSDFVSSVVMVRKVLYAIEKALPTLRFIFLSSAGVYGNPITNPIDENSELNPISPYALHKVLVEDICKYFIRQYNLDIRILRIFSAYGVGLKKQIFWDMAQKVKAYGRLELFGTGNETRDFIYIDDLVKAILLVMENDILSEFIYNLANGVEVRIRETAEIFCEQCGLSRNIIVFTGQEHQGNPSNWCASIKKLKNLGYRHEIDIEDGIAKYVNWLKTLNIV